MKNYSSLLLLLIGLVLLSTTVNAQQRIRRPKQTISSVQKQALPARTSSSHLLRRSLKDVCPCACPLATPVGETGFWMFAVDHKLKDIHGKQKFCVDVPTAQNYKLEAFALCDTICKYQKTGGETEQDKQDEAEIAQESDPLLKEEEEEEEEVIQEEEVVEEIEQEEADDSCPCPCDIGGKPGFLMFAISEGLDKKYGNGNFCIAESIGKDYKLGELAFCDDLCKFKQTDSDDTTEEEKKKEEEVAEQEFTELKDEVLGDCQCHCDLDRPNGEGAGVYMYAQSAALQGKYGSDAFCVSLESSVDYFIAEMAYCDERCKSPAPSVRATEPPTAKPTSLPTATPTVSPTAKATDSPTAKPTSSPTVKPTASPTVKPTESPTGRPTYGKATPYPTRKPSEAPNDSSSHSSSEDESSSHSSSEVSSEKSENEEEILKEELKQNPLDTCKCPCDLRGPDGEGNGVLMIATEATFKKVYGENRPFCVSKDTSVDYYIAELAVCDDSCDPHHDESEDFTEELKEEVAEKESVESKQDEGKEMCPCKCDLPGSEDNTNDGVIMYAMGTALKSRYGEEGFCVTKEASEDYYIADLAFCSDHCEFANDSEGDGTEDGY